MELVVGVNSYMTVEEADSIVNDVFFDDDDDAKLWTSMTDNNKQKIILAGTRLINRLPFLGQQYPGFDRLPWPRLINGVYMECPYDVKAAILKQGLRDRINSNKNETKLQELGVRTYSIKNASVTFGDGLSKIKLNNGVYSDIFSEYLDRWVY